MKKFIYNSVVGKEDFADREEDIKLLNSANLNRRKTVLYAPRRYGKTSLAQNILPKEFKSGHLYVDFMDCSDRESIVNRLTLAYQEMLRAYFKKTYLVSNAANFFKYLSPVFKLDSLTGDLSVTLDANKGKSIQVADILMSLVALCDKKKVLLVFDEFQDLYFFKEDLAILRSHLQRLKNTPMLFLGSKRKLLSEIFSSNQSPFFNFASEYVLKPIDLQDWIPFFDERLKPQKIKLKNEALQYICDEALQVPNSICEIGAFIQDHYANLQIDEKVAARILNEMVQKKSETYRYQLSLLTINEKKVVHALAINSFTESINNHEFVALCGIGASSISRVIQKLYHAGIIEEESKGYRVSNPILSLYLRAFGL